MRTQTFPATLDALTDLIAFLEACLDEFDCPMKAKMSICVAVEEVFVNVAHYAYPESEGDVTLSVAWSKDAVCTLCLSDHGIPFNPLEKEDPDITLSAAEREIGGLGIFLAKKSMDALSYAYKDGSNCLIMTKKCKGDGTV